MTSTNIKYELRLKRKKHIRKNLSGSSERPRLTVFRSAKHIYAQIIDDTCGNTLVSASSVEKEIRERQDLGKKIDTAKIIGTTIANRAKQKGIQKVVFDRNGFLYHGRIKSVSEGAREAGLDF